MDSTGDSSLLGTSTSGDSKPPKHAASKPLVLKYTFSTDTQTQIQLLSALSTPQDGLDALPTLLNSLHIFTATVSKGDLQTLLEAAFTEEQKKAKRERVPKLSKGDKSKSQGDLDAIALANAPKGTVPPNPSPRVSLDSSAQVEGLTPQRLYEARERGLRRQPVNPQDPTASSGPGDV